MRSFEERLKTSLVWLPEYGMGRYPVKLNELPYDKDYFEKYRLMADTDVGRRLNAARVDLVRRHWQGPVLDVGIGSGTFIEAHGDATGFDINPAGVEWLKDSGLWTDLYSDAYPAITMWDSLEHMPEPEKAIAHASGWVFIAIPIFKDGEDILHSHHFKKDEHIFYFTDDGIQRWFAEQGFECVEQNTIECQLGRKGVASYAFRRI